MKLMIALLAALVVAAGSAPAPAAPPASQPAEKRKRLDAEFRAQIGALGKKSDKKVEIVSGPRACKMNRDQKPGQEWVVRYAAFRFKVSISDGLKTDINAVIKQLQKVPASYFKAFVEVSEEKENGVAVYADLGGAAAHGGKDYINIVPDADAVVLVHEIGHTLEQVYTAREPKTLETWAAACKADKVSVSRYGDSVAHEDLAEFSMIYAVCLDAGPEKLAALQKLSPKRFALWAKILRGPGA